MARTTIIAGNWKMNLLPEQGWELVEGIRHQYHEPSENLEVVIIPQMAMVAQAGEWIKESPIRLGAQNCSHEISGAFTGETSPALLKNLGCSYGLAGHSERREMYGETNETVAKKADALLRLGITPIVCLGETLEEREAGTHHDKIAGQVEAIYNIVSKQAWTKLSFAYEPIWAIGTGKTATPDQAEEIHRFVRDQIKQAAGDVVAEATSILYGGSAKPSNAADLLEKENIDGLLVGGASLNPEDFSNIIAAYK